MYPETGASGGAMRKPILQQRGNSEWLQPVSISFFNNVSLKSGIYSYPKTCNIANYCKERQEEQAHNLIDNYIAPSLHTKQNVNNLHIKRFKIDDRKHMQKQSGEL